MEGLTGWTEVEGFTGWTGAPVEDPPDLKKSFDSCDSIMSYWETFKLETLNQKISRMVLGVPNFFSRLATLGELGRFPLFVKGLSHVLKYYANISKSDGNGSLIGLTIREMKNVENPNITTWFSRVEKNQN